MQIMATWSENPGLGQAETPTQPSRVALMVPTGELIQAPAIHWDRLCMRNTKHAKHTRNHASECSLE